MTSIGEKLRRQRLQNRISLETISLETKISQRLLEAMEAEDFDKLPAGLFRRSFVLQYARALGLDEEEISAGLRQLSQFEELPSVPGKEALPDRGEVPAIPSPVLRFDWSRWRTSTLGSFIVAVGVMLACAGIYSWWQRPSRGASSTNASKSGSPAVQTIEPSTPDSKPDIPPAPAALAAPGQAIRVGLTAGEETWVSASSDGKNIFSDALAPSQTKLVEAANKVRLVVGNAGGLEISLNGKPIGPIGPRGQVRVIEFTPSGFQIVPRKPSPEPL